ncbi:hypothetical protein A3224_15605 [Microbulbifer thermotolerans]|uniref:Uncharacterized protein n=1 Tax=Microbulbifer thermotolerans TaxID=252514 RepID=A0A143HQ13_MICTH|nr:hypothetical protein A3224_15605 [Microbulbifer thermotolerans]
MVKRLGIDQDDAQIQFDLERHKIEILEGVQEANIKYGGDLQVQEIEIVPSDYPKEGQARFAAFKISEYVLGKISK